MDKNGYKRKITKACKDAGTYKPYFASAIETLADILEKRDNAEDNFRKLGGNTIVKHTNKAGASNIVKNPALVVIMDLNAQALAYWRDLGLTPSGLKRLNSSAIEQKKEISFENILASLTNE